MLPYSVCPLMRQHLPFTKKGAHLLFLMCLSAALHAQTDIRFQHITVDDGLSQSSISSMVQDKFGYLWIGTRDGLNRYDGSTFVTYLHDKKPHSLLRRSISGLYLDHEDQLWVAYTNGISVYRPAVDHFDNYPLWPDSTSNLYIRDFDAVDDSTILLSGNQGILKFNPISGKLSSVKNYSMFQQKNIANVVISDPGYTWVSSDTVVWRQRRGDTTWQEIFRDQGRIKISYFEKTKELYLRTEFKLLKHDAKSGTFNAIATLASSQWPVSESMLKTSDGHLWVAHGDVSVFDSQDRLVYRGRHVLEDPNSLSGPFASVIYETRDGVVWVGTNGLGINKYDPYRSVFNYIGHYPGADVTLWDNYITSIYSEDDTHLLVGTLEGISLIDLEKRKSVYKPIIGKDGRTGRVQDVFKDSNNRTWLCTNRGLMQLDAQTVKPSGIPQFDDPNLNIYEVATVDSHQFLFATSTSVYLWDQRNNRIEMVFPFGTPVIKKIGNEYWLESGNQIRVLELRTKKIIRTFPRNGSDSIRAPLGSLKVIHVDGKNNVWIGTEGGGLSFYNATDGTFRHYTEKDGLPNSVVYGILEDETGNLWLSTNKGLSVLNPATSTFVRHFTRNDGLQSNEFNTRAFFKSPHGVLYFGGVEGLSYFDADRALNIPIFTPKTIVTGFYLNNVRQEQDTHPEVNRLFSEQRIILDWTERNFGFDIAGLGFTFPSGVMYQYKLEGYDNNWNQVGNQSRLSFTNIPSGSYTLLIKSGNRSGQWEQEPLAIHITVVTPFWKSVWFIAGFISLVILLVFIAYDQRIKFLKRRAVQLQNMVDERTREIQRQQEEIAAQNEELAAQAETLEHTNAELEQRVERRTSRLRQLNEELVEQNTQLEQFAFITAHNIRGPIARIHGLISLLQTDNLAEITRHLETSVKNLDEVITDLNAVLSITHNVGTKFELVAVREQLNLVLASLSSDIEHNNATVDITGFEDVDIMGLKAYFQSIFHNLIHNALKYSDTLRKPVITCRTQRVENRILLIVEDNGIGIDMRYAKDKIFKLHQRFHSNTIGKGIGLYLVKTQVKVMRGKITVDSELNVGTRFTIDLPAPDAKS